MTIDTADFPTAHTKAKVIHEKSQAVSREIGAALARIGKGRPSAPKKTKYGRLAICLAILHDSHGRFGGGAPWR